MIDRVASSAPARKAVFCNRVSHNGRSRLQSTGKRSSPPAGDAEEGLWGTQGSRKSNTGSLPRLPKSPAQGARRTPKRRGKGRKAKSPYGAH